MFLQSNKKIGAHDKRGREGLVGDGFFVLDTCRGKKKSSGGACKQALKVAQTYMENKRVLKQFECDFDLDLDLPP